MSKRKKREARLPGNDGRWFLELVGAEQPPPSTTSKLAELASPDPDAIPGVEVTSTMGGHGGVLLGHDAGTDTTGTEATTTAVPDSDTGEFVPVPRQRRPDETDSSLDDWQPDELARPLRSHRTVRWTVILLAVVVAAAVVAGIVWLPRVERRQASRVADDYASAMVDLRNELPNSQEALAFLTDPQSTDDDLATVIPATADLQAKAHTVSELGSGDLPAGMWFVPGSPMAALADTHQQMAFLGASGEQIATRIGRGYVYRTTIPDLLATDTLPTSVGNDQTVNQLSVELASSLAQSVDLVAQLPSDDAFDATRQLAVDSVQRFEDWIIDYLASLRSDDTDGAQALITELNGLRSDLADSTARALLVMRGDVDQEIIDLAQQTETTIGAIPF